MKRFLSLISTILCLVSASSYGVTPFELQQMNGEGGIYKMSDHPNGIFVVEAYFLGCHYCNENAPKVNELSEKFASDPRVQVLDVGVDRKITDYETWIKRHNPNHPVLNDGKKKLIGQFGTTGYPSTYVFDCKGRVAYQSVGSWGIEEQEGIENAIIQLQAQECKVETAPTEF